jgi:methionyl-tRNA formyltransferase
VCGTPGGCGRCVCRLPAYRGALPLNWALANRERVHGITIHVIDTGIDSGPVLAEAVFSIWPDVDEVEDVWERCMGHGRLLISDTLPPLHRIVPRPQDESLAVTYRLRDSAALGDRSDWTRAATTDNPRDPDQYLPHVI